MTGRAGHPPDPGGAVIKTASACASAASKAPRSLIVTGVTPCATNWAALASSRLLAATVQPFGLSRAFSARGYAVDLDSEGHGHARRGTEWRAVMFGAMARFVQFGITMMASHGSTVIQLNRQCDGWISAAASARQERETQKLLDALSKELNAPCLRVNAA